MSSDRRSVRSAIPGLILIIIGCLILINKLDLINFRLRNIFPYLILLLGIWFLYRLIGQNHRSAAFPATFFLLLGIFLVLRKHSYYFWNIYHFEDFWPVILLIVGFAFLVQFIARPKDWGLLIPSLILIFIGSLFFAQNIGWIYIYDLEYYCQLYWPIILILIGMGLIFSNLRRRVESG